MTLIQRIVSSSRTPSPLPVLRFLCPPIEGGAWFLAQHQATAETFFWFVHLSILTFSSYLLYLTNFYALVIEQCFYAHIECICNVSQLTCRGYGISSLILWYKRAIYPYRLSKLALSHISYLSHLFYTHKLASLLVSAYYSVYFLSNFVKFSIFMTL